MSEYQYYEFRTINRQLTAAQRAEVNKLSSHGETTATSFSVNYSYGDFKHKPEEVLARYFDCFFYIANWGSVQLMFRYPKELIDTRALEPYCIDGQITIDCKTVGDSVILSFALQQEEGFDWIQGEGTVDGVIGLYAEIMERDVRAFYLAWLRAIQDGTEYGDEVESDEFDGDEVDNDQFDADGFNAETLEPPVPPGLNARSPALDAFVNLFGIDGDLIAVAAKASAQSQPTAQIDVTAALAALSKEECIDFLQRLLQGEAHLELKLKQRLGLLQSKTAYVPTGQRTVGKLLTARDALEQARQKAAAAAKEVQRRAQMAALAAKGERAWQEVETLIEQKTSEGYKQAVALLVQLQALASEQKQERAFASRIADLRSRYSRRSGLMRELERVHL